MNISVEELKSLQSLICNWLCPKKAECVAYETATACPVYLKFNELLHKK